MAFDLGRFSQAWREWWGPAPGPGLPLIKEMLELAEAVNRLERRAGDLQAQVNANDRQNVDLALRVDATQEALAPLPADLAALARRFSAHLEVHRGEEEGIRRSTGTALAHRLDIVDTTLGSTVTRVEGLERKVFANDGRGPDLPRPLPPWESCVVYRTANAWAVSDAREVEHYGGALAWATTYVFDDMEAAGRFMHAVLTQPRDGKGS